MARKNKPVKIKRYKNSMGSSSQSVAAVKKIVPFIAGAVLLIVLGFLLGKPVINFISGIGSDDSSSSQRSDISQSTVVSQPVEEQNSSSDISSQEDSSDISAPPVSAVGNRVYYYVNASALTSEGGMDSVIRQMKAKGATHLVFDVKNADGYVHYASSNQYASQLPATEQIDIALLADKLKDNGITPVARVYTFMDKMISTVERTTAVMYQGTDTRWLDTSAALGGKAWANPASKIMQDYIIALTDEILSLGVDEIIYAGFSTPTGYSLDKRDFGASMDQVLANMKNLIVTLQAKISAKGGYSAWQFEYAAVLPDGSYAQYIVHPYQLGAENIILTARGTDIDVAAAVTALKTAGEAEEISDITLWLTDNADTEAVQALDNYFTF